MRTSFSKHQHKSSICIQQHKVYNLLCTTFKTVRMLPHCHFLPSALVNKKLPVSLTSLQCVIVIIIIIINNKDCIQGTVRDFLQSPHCAVRDFLQFPHRATNCLQHVRSSSQGAIVCKLCATVRAFIVYNMSCATWYEGTA